MFKALLTSLYHLLIQKFSSFILIMRKPLKKKLSQTYIKISCKKNFPLVYDLQNFTIHQSPYKIPMTMCLSLWHTVHKFKCTPNNIELCLHTIKPRSNRQLLLNSIKTEVRVKIWSVLLFLCRKLWYFYELYFLCRGLITGCIYFWNHRYLNCRENM